MHFKQYFILLFLLVYSSISYAQLTLVNEPKQGAFLAQNPNTGLASLQFYGTVSNPTYPKLKIKIYQSNTLFKNIAYNLNYTNSKANFSFKTDLPVGKYIYKIKMELIGKDTIYREIGGIIVGDVYIIQGQSNAVASTYSAYDNNYLDTFLRSFGTSSNIGNYTIADLNWHPINPIYVYRSGSVGQWAGVMAKQLLDSFGIPICLMNGAVGGTRITQHQPTLNNHDDVNTIYGRLLYRINAAKLNNKIRGILYFQGESDGANANLHDSLFRKLTGYWRRDFQGFKKLYVIQVRSGCGSPTIQLRDVQRKFQNISGTQVVSANGLNAHDGCHYKFKNGYEDLGIQMAAILGRDFYNSKRKNVDPPNISKCYFSNSKETEITLEMTNPMDSVFVDNNFQSLFRIEGDPAVTVSGGFLRDNKVILTLNKSSCSPLGLTYDGLRWSQPWVKNATKMGLISFYNIPINRVPVRRGYQLCKNGSVLLKADSVDGCSYSWKRDLTNKYYLSSEVLHKSNVSETYTLYVAYDVSVCKQIDSFSVIVNLDKANIPSLINDTVICLGDTLSLGPNYNEYSSFTWKDKDTSIVADRFFVWKETPIELIARSNMGCIYKDSINVLLSSPSVHLPRGIILCPNSDSLITVPNLFKSYSWNNSKNTTNSYLSKKGQLTITVLDSFKCTATDTAFILEHPSAYSSFKDRGICASETRKISKPKNIKTWSKESVSLMDSLELFPNTTIHLELVDSNQCFYKDTITIGTLPLPIFNLGKDTGFCSNGSLLLSVPNGNYQYFWNNLPSDKNLNLVNKEGQYFAKIIDNKNLCSFSDTINIESYPSPAMEMFKDTTLCFDSIWRVFVPKGSIYRLNGNVIKGYTTFTKKGVYYLTAESIHSCKTNKTIKLDFIDCSTSVGTSLKIDEIKIYPNPSVNGYIYLMNKTTNKSAILFDINGLKVTEIELIRGENTIDLIPYKDGIYIIQIGNWSYKIIKQSGH